MICVTQSSCYVSSTVHGRKMGWKKKEKEDSKAPTHFPTGLLFSTWKVDYPCSLSWQTYFQPKPWNLLDIFFHRQGHMLQSCFFCAGNFYSRYFPFFH